MMEIPKATLKILPSWDYDSPVSVEEFFFAFFGFAMGLFVAWLIWPWVYSWRERWFKRKKGGE